MAKRFASGPARDRKGSESQGPGCIMTDVDWLAGISRVAMHCFAAARLLVGVQLLRKTARDSRPALPALGAASAIAVSSERYSKTAKERIETVGDDKIERRRRIKSEGDSYRKEIELEARRIALPRDIVALVEIRAREIGRNCDEVVAEVVNLWLQDGGQDPQAAPKRVS